MAVAPHLCLQRRQLLEGGDRALGAVLLHETDHGVQHHDRHDHQGVHHVADHSRDDRRADQHQDHEIGELSEEHRHRPAPHALADLVGAIAFAALTHLVPGQTGMQVGAQALGGLLDRQLMPGGLAGLKQQVVSAHD